MDVSGFAAMIDHVATTYPNFQVIATTLRRVRSATLNDWGALAWSRVPGLVRATQRDGLEIMDRVGGGDSIASGLIAALLEGQDLTTAVGWGAAHQPWDPGAGQRPPVVEGWGANAAQRGRDHLEVRVGGRDMVDHRRET